jgi:hypothetical protein
MSSHHFHNNLFSRMIQIEKYEDVEKTYPSNCDKIFNLWVIVVWELHSVEDRACG